MTTSVEPHAAMGEVAPASPTPARPLWLWMAPLLLIALLPVVLPGPGIVVGDTVTSRLATVWALAHDGGWHIDRPAALPPNPFERHTVDKVQLPNGRLISSKPPILPLLMTGEYLLMRRWFGWDLERPEDLRPILRTMIATLVKAPYAVGLAFFAMTLALFFPPRFTTFLPVLLLAFASPVPGFASQLNNHTPAASVLMIVMYFGMGLYAGKLAPAPWRFAVFGGCSAWVFVTDMPATVFPAMLGLLLLWRFPRQATVWAGLGALPLLAAHFLIMAAITGNPIPVQLREEMYWFRNSYWRNPIGVDGLNERRSVYLFHMTFGRFGTFLLFPVTLLGLWGGLKWVFAGDRRQATMAAALLAAFVIMNAYYLFHTNNYGGAAYGFRWHIAAVPALIWLSAPLLSGMRSPWRWALTAILLAVSLYSAWECRQAPWGAGHEWTSRLLFGPVY